MITIDQYFGKFDKTDELIKNAAILLSHVNPLLVEAGMNGIKLPVNPSNNTQLSGYSFGGFRPSFCPIGAPDSAHKQAMAVDVYDPNNDLDNWLTDQKLEEYNLYREAPESTHKWCHLTTRAPGSGHRTFSP